MMTGFFLLSDVDGDAFVAGGVGSWREWFAGAKDREITPEVLKKAINQTNGAVMRHIPDRFFTEELALFGVDRPKGGFNLKFVPWKFRTKAVCLAAIKRTNLYSYGYRYELPYRCRDDPEYAVLGKRLAENAAAPGGIPPESQSPEFAFEVLLHCPENAVEFLVPELLTEELRYAAVSHISWLSMLPRELLTPELCHFAVAADSKDLQYVPPEWITREMCYTALVNAGVGTGDIPSLKFVPERFKTYDLCRMAVREWPASLEFVPEEHKTEELCRDAFDFRGGSLNSEVPRFVPEKYLTEEFCLFMVRKNPSCFEYIPDSRKTAAICLRYFKDAISIHRDDMKKIPDRLLSEEVCVTLLKMKGRDEAVYVLKSIPTRLRTLAVCVEAVKRNGAAISGVPKKFLTDDGKLNLEYTPPKKTRK